MIRLMMFAAALSVEPAGAQSLTGRNPELAAFAQCLGRAAEVLNDQTSDPSIVADKISVACRKEWEAAQASSTRNLTMDDRALFEAQSAQIERRVATAVVIKLRELKQTNAPKGRGL
jgi:hypothetical protein